MLRSFAASVCGILIALVAQAAGSVTVVPPDLAPGSIYRLVLITGGTMQASSADIGDYNDFVTAQAEQSAALLALGTGWSVIGSTPFVDARTATGTDPNVHASRPIYNLAGERIANDYADLWDGQLANAIDVDQHGNTWSGRSVFTGTAANGVGIANRQLSGPNGFRVQFGWNDATSASWINANDWSGTLAARQFYAISNDLIVVPEPGSLVLVAAGLIWIGGGRRYAAGRRGGATPATSGSVPRWRSGERSARSAS